MGLLGLAECTMSRAMLEEDRCLVLTLIGAGNDMHKGFIRGYVTPSAVGSCFVAYSPISPLMIITGDRKKKKAAWEPIRTLYDHAPAPKYLIRLRKTDHMAVSDLGVLVSNPVAKLHFPGFRFH
jgi:hypothetical protein